MKYRFFDILTGILMLCNMKSSYDFITLIY